MLNLSTGEDDEERTGGDIAAQMTAPVAPMPPPVSQAPGPELIPPQGRTVSPAPGPQVPAIPTAPAVAPYVPQVPAPIPVSRAVTPAESANLTAIDRATSARTATAQDQGNVNAAQRAEQVKAADAQNDEAQRFLTERTRIQDEAANRIKERTSQANADYEAYKKFGIKDPDADQSFATKILKAIVVGMGQYAAGVNGGPNAAAQILTDANRENIARQKAQQEKLFQVAQRSGKNVEEAQRERDDAFKQLDLKHSALLESSAAMLRKELARLGVPQAQIDANKEIQKIEGDALAIRERTLGGIRDDETALARADIAAAARAKKPAAGGGGGGKNLDAAGKLAEYAEKNPGDVPGLYRFAATVPGATKKDVTAALNQSKVPEGAQGTAVKANAALQAIDRIDKLGYKPSREDIQTWLNNQRQVATAEEAGKGGGVKSVIGGFVAGQAQKRGYLAQNEYDGLSPRARMYFTNVRQYMENIGREASGAAISQGEWNNFYGQYGPQSEGGLEAARQNIRDRFKLTGVAGRQLEASGSTPDAKGPAASAGGKREDPRAKLARDAIADPKASQAVKARALQILRSLGQVDQL